MEKVVFVPEGGGNLLRNCLDDELDTWKNVDYTKYSV